MTIRKKEFSINCILFFFFNFLQSIFDKVVNSSHLLGTRGVDFILEQHFSVFGLVEFLRREDED